MSKTMLPVDYPSPLEHRTVSIGQAFVGCCIITDSPTKEIYSRVQWFDTRRLTYNEARALTSGMTHLGDSVMFDCFDQIAMVVRVADFGGRLL